MVFEVLLLVGFFGFLAMTLLGMSHGHGGHGGGHGLHHAAGSHAGAHAHAGHGHGSSHGLAKAMKSERGGLPFFLSPMALFSLALGAGATGMLLQKVVSQPLLSLAAIGGALLFNFGVVKPMTSLIFRFGGTPSEGLNAMVAHSVEAATGFDASGRGVVRASLDGQVVQLLATLEKSECDRGTIVRKGEELVVTEVDLQRGTCRVTKELS